MADKISVNMNLPIDTDQRLEQLAADDLRGKAAEITWLVDREFERRQGVVVNDSVVKTPVTGM